MLNLDISQSMWPFQILFKSRIGIKSTYIFVDRILSLQLQKKITKCPTSNFFILWHAIACTKTVDTMQKFRVDSQTSYAHMNLILDGNYCTSKFHVFTSYFFEIHFITVLPSTPRSFVVSSLQFIPPEPCMPLSFPPYFLHELPIILDLIN